MIPEIHIIHLGVIAKITIKLNGILYVNHKQYLPRPF